MACGQMWPQLVVLNDVTGEHSAVFLGWSMVALHQGSVTAADAGLGSWKCLLSGPSLKKCASPCFRSSELSD